MSGATSKAWIKYVSPCYAIQERRGVLVRYEVRLPELEDLCVGMVEQYLNEKEKLRWRTLTPKLDDWRDDFRSREAASQDLVANCPVVAERMKNRRKRMRDAKLAESQTDSP